MAITFKNTNAVFFNCACFPGSAACTLCDIALEIKAKMG